VGEQFKLKNNQIFILAEAAGGVYNSDQLRMLCEVADRESAFLKITEDQRIGFMIEPDKLNEIQTQVRKSGLLLRHYQSSGVPYPRACLGELCQFAQQPALGDALELTTHLLKTFPNPQRFSSIALNGCHRACLGSSTEDIHIVAEESGYKISIGGKNSDIAQQAHLLVENISRNELPLVIEKILSLFYQESKEEERLHEVIDRIGMTPFFEALPVHHVSQSSMIPANEISHSELTTESELGATGSDFESSAQAELSIDAEFDETGIDDEVRMMPVIDSDLQSNRDLQSETFTDNELLTEAADTDEPPAGELGQDLLEVTDDDLSEGSLDDVERVRDAIRTELSMSDEPIAQERIAASTVDLLDEIDSSTSETLNDTEDLKDSEAFNDFNSLNAAEDGDSEFQQHQGIDDEDGLALDEMKEISEDTAASLEHAQRFSPIHRPLSERTQKQGQSRKNPTDQEAAFPMQGRLGVRFVGEMLSVELPSGFSFELPFESLNEGGSLSLSLPDGELQILRDGQWLEFSLGRLTLKIPQPHGDDWQAA
jgi:dissimilatory sulfite reductase (desulfoviridin) alpha/beta subunit